ncbi:protein phosphatase 2C domain-containing protein [Photorhabdus bodei]|uniref:PP2C family protein-serine/threonine phosphatase n=1 Tax=Photorhabdus bodei TaxID=2029681 RepID=UPI0032B87505
MINLLNCGLFSCRKDDKKENQDSIMPPMSLGHGYIFAVADGVGAYEGAKEASLLAINYLSKLTPDEVADIGAVFTSIKNQLPSLLELNSKFYSSATTLTFCYVDNRNVHIGHVGDTRVYVRKESKLIQLSKDHTVHQELFDEGLFTKKELKELDGKNTLTSALSRVAELQYQKICIPVSDLISKDGTLDVYVMSDGAHHFWEKRPRFSHNTVSNPVRFAASLQRRIENAPPIDDYSLVAAGFKIE